MEAVNDAIVSGYADLYKIARGKIKAGQSFGISDVDDIVQNAAIAVYVKGFENHRAAVRITTCWALRGKYRDAKKSPGCITDADAVSESVLVSAGPDSLDSVLAAELWDVVATLPPDVAQAIELRYKFGYALQDIAEKTGLSVFAVSRRIAKGLKALKDVYNGEETE